MFHNAQEHRLNHEHDEKWKIKDKEGTSINENILCKIWKIDSQPWFAAWPRLSTSMPAQVAATCRYLGSSCPGRTLAAANLGLHLLVGPRATARSGQLQTTLKCHRPTTFTSDTLQQWTQQAPEPYWNKSCSVELASEQPILCSDQYLVVGVHSQSLQLMKLGVNPPSHLYWHADFNQGSSYKGRKVCSARTSSAQLGWSERLDGLLDPI